MDVDWLGALIGAVAGALLTALGGYAAYRIERSKIERSALIDLVTSLSERRAFRIPSPRMVPDAGLSDDFDRLNRSVITVREEIRGTRSAIVRNHADKRTLTTMIQLCNEYLEASAEDPEQYWFLAAGLRDELHRHLMTLRIRTSDVPEPGSRAFLPTP